MLDPEAARGSPAAEPLFRLTVLSAYAAGLLIGVSVLLFGYNLVCPQLHLFTRLVSLQFFGVYCTITAVLGLIAVEGKHRILSAISAFASCLVYGTSFSFSVLGGRGPGPIPSFVLVTSLFLLSWAHLNHSLLLDWSGFARVTRRFSHVHFHIHAPEHQRS